jgi:hypothetical protein
MTPSSRYEVGWMRDDAANVNESTSLKAVAIQWARKASESTRAKGYTYYVFDRMARRGCICRWDFENGEIVNQVRRDK